MTLVMDMIHCYQISFDGMITTQWLWLWTMGMVMGVSNTTLMFASFQDLCPAITVSYYYLVCNIRALCFRPFLIYCTSLVLKSVRDHASRVI
jgi:hypothetical protein